MVYSYTFVNYDVEFQLLETINLISVKSYPQVSIFAKLVPLKRKFQIDAKLVVAVEVLKWQKG